jgi:CRISPR-associated protein Csx10
MSLKLTFKIEMQSDYHVGSGYGLRTEIDSALLRDASGTPVLRGSILSGLLRDALWQLLQHEPLQSLRRCQDSGLDTTEVYCGQYATAASVEQCPICRLLGTPRAMKRWRIGSAHLDGANAANDDPESQRVARVRVNPRTRRAAPRQLFSQEYGGQWVFRFTIACPVADETALDEAALWVAAARFVRQLGRSRRRGLGECLFSLTGVEGIDLGDDPQDTLLRRFEEHWLKGELQALTESARVLLSHLPSVASDGQPVRLLMLARADEPLLIAKRASAGNQFRGQPLITGKTLRGALATRAADRFDLRDTATYDAFVAVFLRQGARFPNLLPVFRGEPVRSEKDQPEQYLSKQMQLLYPAAPTPRDGFGCKIDTTHPIQWGTKDGQVERCADKDCGGQVKGVREGFTVLNPSDPRRFKPDMCSEMHIRVAPQKGRVIEGQLFEYEALEAGQYFVGELVCADEAAWDLLQEFTGVKEGEAVAIRLGKGSRRGYGRVTLHLKRLSDEPPVWIRQPIDTRVKPDDSELILTLLTDTIVTDAWGRFVTGFKDDWLEKELGFPVSVLPGRSFSVTWVVDGFNTQLRLPRWRDIALAAGSSVRLLVKGQPEKETLQKALRRIEFEGIGLRRDEGYGQVAFNHPIYKNCTEVTTDALDALPQGEMTKTFEQEWAEALDGKPDKAWNDCQGDPFVALSRWLDAHRNENIAGLLMQMQGLGQPDALLVERVGGKQEYGDRQKNSRLTEAGLAPIQDLLKQLQGHKRANWPLGIRMLADRLAEAAGQKEAGR